MGVLGHKVFESLTSRPEELSDDLPLSEQKGVLLYLKRKNRKSDKVIEATCLHTAEGFVVKSGSHIELKDSGSIPPGIKAKRDTAKINKISAEGVLQEDILFNSPSYAAAFVIGGHVNGLTEWKTAEGKTLKEVENSEANDI
jgi:hypothetical protein